jgi:hypothetical protein
VIQANEMFVGGTSRPRWVWLLVSVVGAGIVVVRVLRRMLTAYAGALSDQGGPPSSGTAGGEQSDPTAAEARATANERSDGVRRTADDRLVHPVAAGESDPAAAADPTVAPDTMPGRPTGTEAP